MEEKILDKEFTDDIYAILRNDVEYDSLSAYDLIKKALIEKI